MDPACAVGPRGHSSPSPRRSAPCSCRTGPGIPFTLEQSMSHQLCTVPAACHTVPCSAAFLQVTRLPHSPHHQVLVHPSPTSAVPVGCSRLFCTRLPRPVLVHTVL
ncbi:hypothetical protein GDO81_023676 [Engystomops pustulosus]|uniref:Uncharacterized protein n=1 Tax=Engystomops pustulosus TaxID=76066 RepID=A0AAV6Z943_ENGPU|nr:hypothetical protein GDO81_023676 [Engystomops pustulosus]